MLTQEELHQAFEGELQRLIIKGLTPEQEVIARRYYSDKERQGMDADQFCGPHRSFPITNAEDVKNAARLIGHADDPAAVKACVMRKAKANGWPIPDAWKEEDGESASKERSTPSVIQQSDRVTMSLPLFRIDANKREVWGQATAEVPDSYGTIFGYYPEAWKKWRGNIREQHDPKKAIGNRIDLECNDVERAIYVGSRVSRGANDTWLKVEDNVLIGYSASIIPDAEFGVDPKKWPTKEYNGKHYPYLPRYTVAELSLVDNPACPNCDIQIVRADGFATDILDTTEEAADTTSSLVASSESSLERAGARVSGGTRGAMHDSIKHTLRAAVSQMKNCGDDCEQCQHALSHIDPDNDGDIDLGGYDDPDGDWKSLYKGGRSDDMERAVAAMIERIVTAQMQTVYTRFQAIAGTLARSNSSTLESTITGAIERAIEAATTAHEASLSTVRADLSAVKETVARIDATPVPGAPIMNAGATRPPEKRLPTDPPPDLYARQASTGSAVADAMRQLSEAGQLNTFDRQMQALSTGLLLQQQEKARR